MAKKNKLGITAKMVVEAKFKEYLDKVPNEEKRKKFVDEMVEAVKLQIQQKIDEAEELLESIMTQAKAAGAGVAGYVTSAVTADPVAPVASAGIIANTAASVGNIKATITGLTDKLTTLTGIITNFGLPLPPPVQVASELISTTMGLLNTIPIP